MALHRNIILRTFVTYLLGCLVSIPFVLIALVLIVLPASARYQNKIFFYLTSWWSSTLLWIAGLTRTETDRSLLPTQPAIFVMNHASALDILLIEELLRAQPRLWLSKDEYRATPFLNWLLQRMHVMVNASSPLQGAQALRDIQRKAAAYESHVLLFPEGGRYDDGVIRRFYKGFSLLSSSLNRPVVPIYIANAHRAYPRASLLVRSQEPLSLFVGPSFFRGEQESHEEFTNRVRAWFIAQSGIDA